MLNFQIGSKKREKMTSNKNLNLNAKIFLQNKNIYCQDANLDFKSEAFM